MTFKVKRSMSKSDKREVVVAKGSDQDRLAQLSREVLHAQVESEKLPRPKKQRGELSELTMLNLTKHRYREPKEFPLIQEEEDVEYLP